MYSQSWSVNTVCGQTGGSSTHLSSLYSSLHPAESSWSGLTNPHSTSWRLRRAPAHTALYCAPSLKGQSGPREGGEGKGRRGAWEGKKRETHTVYKIFTYTIFMRQWIHLRSWIGCIRPQLWFDIIQETFMYNSDEKLSLSSNWLMLSTRYSTVTSFHKSLVHKLEVVICQ